MKDHYRWWFQEASIFAHASPLSAAMFLNQNWRNSAYRHATYFATRALAATVAPEAASAFDLPQTTTSLAIGQVFLNIKEWPAYAMRESVGLDMNEVMRPDVHEV